MPFSGVAKPPLARNEREIVAEFQKQSFELGDEHVFKTGFRGLRSRKFQHKRIFRILTRYLTRGIHA